MSHLSCFATYVLTDFFNVSFDTKKVRYTVNKMKLLKQAYP